MTSRCDITQANFGRYGNSFMSLKLWEKENKTVVVIDSWLSFPGTPVLPALQVFETNSINLFVLVHDILLNFGYQNNNLLNF